MSDPRDVRDVRDVPPVPRGSGPPGGIPGIPGIPPEYLGPVGPVGAERHLDDLAAMRLADGEAVSPAAQQHAAACAVCSALVAGFRQEAAAFAGAFALDADECAVLAAARLPQRLAAFVAQSPWAQPLPQRESPASLAAIVAVAIGGYAGWWALTSAAEPYVRAAQDLGLGSIALQVLGTLLIRFFVLLWQVAAAAAELPWVEAPALPALLTALLALIFFWMTPRFAPRRLEAV
jgi:hypothetical protein